MIPVVEITYLLIALQIIMTFVNYRVGLGLYLFIIMVLPHTLRLTDFLGLNPTRLCSLFLLGYIILKRLPFNENGKALNFNFYRNLIVFSLFILPSFFMAHDNPGTFRQLYVFVIFFLTDLFLPGFIIYSLIRNRGDLLFVCKTIVFAVFIMGLFGLVEYLTGFNNIFWTSLKSEMPNIIIWDYKNLDNRLGFTNRIKSTNYHPIIYGGRLAAYSIIVYLLIIRKEYFKLRAGQNAWLISVLVLLIVNMILTLSRSCWLALIVSTSLLFFWERNAAVKNANVKAILAIVSPIFIVAIFVVVQFLANSNFGGSTVEMRSNQFDFIMSKFVMPNFYTGLGPDATQILITSGENETALGFESFIFEVMVNHGIMGAIGYLFLYITLIVKAFKMRLISPVGNYILALIIGHIVFIIFTGEMYNFMIFWVILMILIRTFEITRFSDTIIDRMQTIQNTL